MMNSFFGMDPYDYLLGYPHYDVEKIKISDNDFIFNVKDTKIHVSREETIQSTGNLFNKDFVCANSQIYRGSNGATNVNFFNQDFIDARVTSLDPKKNFLQEPWLTSMHYARKRTWFQFSIIRMLAFVGILKTSNFY